MMPICYAAAQIKMNNRPVDHLCRVLGRSERRRDGDLVEMKSEISRERGRPVKQARQRGFSQAEAPSPSV